ncbi:Gamma-aminobutyric acid receptor subunit rho-2 GABA(A) receptor subunit rho-2 GABA(C) receptor [Collichthys lucidus]|uniref:Gamma-aminobutyric acid receptor subunit rho-2 GABA(A) receptor subunit rho-2 GABA(C) receptor n=1 Tax=Collichthys lucidus TaxID=240159 RepID=A0A4U5VEW0_COLLU|nr:Gamma-aminobutyric acid receptor subunit rho-2 GABA(A) receptor subunit rho-2 GABA(C) receptor [Collichthys lucidus]
MPYMTKPLILLLCLVVTGECRRHGHRVRRWTGTVETQKHGTSLAKKPPDVTKSRKVKTEHLLKVDDHDFTMRPAFGVRQFVNQSLVDFISLRLNVWSRSRLAANASFSSASIITEQVWAEHFPDSKATPADVHTVLNKVD